MKKEVRQKVYAKYDEQSDTQIDIIRKRYPVSLDELNRYSSFEQTLGRHQNDYTSVERRMRWNKVMSLSRAEAREMWTDTSECVECKHLDISQAWCNLQDLPCTVNPVVTFGSGMIGMACCGAGMTPKTTFEEQDELF